MDDASAAQLFKNVVRQFQQQLGIEIAGYLLQTYQMGQRDIAFTDLIGCLVDLGYNEEELLQKGPLAELADFLGIPKIQPAEPDRSAIQTDPSKRPDPFAVPPQPIQQLAPEQSQQEPASPPQQPAISQQSSQDHEGTLHIRSRDAQE